MDNLIRIQNLNVEDIKSDESVISVDPNGDMAEFSLYDDSEYLNGSVSGSDVPSDVKSGFGDDVRRNTTLVSLKYKSDYKGLSVGDDFPTSVQKEVWDFCLSHGEAVLSQYQH
ncbi:hypothetical protein [uncultured Gilvimarinus sp.]|uniref:hypothetical protein n=1 Tax=uncultured Gilvimarinus sp. TaxID=1689143 RepID=UPI0030ED2BC7|tara:strand:- start:13036 stop:13374 length:339 start_codon:yes stop_codon:yes gene_type:complete